MNYLAQKVVNGYTFRLISHGDLYYFVNKKAENVSVIFQIVSPEGVVISGDASIGSDYFCSNFLELTKEEKYSDLPTKFNSYFAENVFKEVQVGPLVDIDQHSDVGEAIRAGFRDSFGYDKEAYARASSKCFRNYYKNLFVISIDFLDTSIVFKEFDEGFGVFYKNFEIVHLDDNGGILPSRKDLELLKEKL